MKKILLLSTLAALGLTLGVSAANDPAPPAAPAVQDPPKDPPKEDPKPDEKKKDATTATAEIGKPAPEFALQNLDGKTIKLSDYKGKLVVLEWFNPKCPTCVWAYSETGPLRELPERLKKEGVVWLAVNSDAEGGGAVDVNKEFIKANKVDLQVLLDPTGKVGKTYGAKTTPHCMVIDEKGILRYRGALDNAPNGRVKEGESKTNYVQKAVEELKGGKAVTTSETKSYG
jgi:peroxiredoxin